VCLCVCLFVRLCTIDLENQKDTWVEISHIYVVLVAEARICNEILKKWKNSDIRSKSIFLKENRWSVLGKSSKIKISENFLSRSVSGETIKNMTWFSTMLDRMVKIFFSLALPSRSTVSTYTQNHDLDDFLHSKCVSIEAIRILTWFSTVPDRMVKIFVSCHPPLALYRLRIHRKSRLGDFSRQQVRSWRNDKKLTFVSSMPDRMMKILKYFFPSHTSLALQPPHSRKIRIWRIFFSENTF